MRTARVKPPWNRSSAAAGGPSGAAVLQWLLYAPKGESLTLAPALQRASTAEGYILLARQSYSTDTLQRALREQLYVVLLLASTLFHAYR